MPLAPHTAPVPAPVAAPAAVVVVVQAGQTLTSIAAAEHLSSWHVLYEANAAHVADPDVIYPGERLALHGHETPMVGSYRLLAAAQPVADYQPGPSLPAAVPVSTGGGYEECVITHESGGDPQVVNQASGAGGLVQFLPSTWATTPWGSQYPGGAQTAPASIQLEAFQWEYARDGTAPWVTDGCS